MPSPEEHYRMDKEHNNPYAGYIKVGDKWVKPTTPAEVSTTPPDDFKEYWRNEALKKRLEAAQAELKRVTVECPISRTVMERVAERARTGMKTYGVTMERTDVTTVGWIDHAIEELLDGAVYLTRLKNDILKLAGHDASL